MKLYLVRHGRSAGNLPGRMTGWSEHPLTRLGPPRRAAWPPGLHRSDRCPSTRATCPGALDTARLIAARWAPARECATAANAEAAQAVGVFPDRRLREIDLGDYEGRSWDEFSADRALAAAFLREPLSTRLPGGESLAMVRERVVSAFDEIVRREHAVACLVSHDGPIRTILNHVLEVPPERHWAISTSHGGLSLLETNGDWVSVRFVNDTSHLRGLAADPDGVAAAEAPARALEHSAEHRGEGAGGPRG